MNQSRITRCCFAVFFLAFFTPVQGSGQSVDPDRERATALWEEAIRAKGGRERLHSIHNLLISSTIDVRDRNGSHEKETERLYLMPGGAWIYTYTPDFTVSLDVTVINKERQFCWVTLAPARSVPGLSLCIPSTPVKYLVQDPVIYLMETDWLRPEPLRVRTEGKGRKQLDVIETRVAMLRVDFYLDRKTRLPVKLVTEWYGGIGQATDGGGPMTVELEDYVEIEGIFMPRRVTREPEGNAPVGEVFRRDTERANYRFNVTYDPKILKGPASKETKRSDWKVKDKTGATPLTTRATSSACATRTTDTQLVSDSYE